MPGTLCQVETCRLLEAFRLARFKVTEAKNEDFNPLP
jgi:hypothetical protein